VTDYTKLELEDSISHVATKTLQEYTIPITIKNDSSIGFQKAEVTVQDTESHQTVTANFGHIPAKTSSTENVQLPGGVDLCVFTIYPDVGEDIRGGGAGNNVKAVVITVSD
jgi:hypothetical protein